MHLGVARTSLIAWLCARAASGRLVLRIEDIDTPRVVPGSAEQIMDELRFLGLDWDEGPDLGGPFAPYVQSQRGEHYATAIETLRTRGLVYPCTCSRKEIALIGSAPHGELGPRYPGTCRNGPSHPGRPEALRFRMSETPACFVDRVHGPQPARVGDDFVLRRADGVYAYQLAVVVDDIAMKISEVVRGDDLLTSTPRQLELYRGLSAPPPAFAHVPLALGADGRRLSKRFGSRSVSELRAAGASAERIVSYLAHSLDLVLEGQLCSARDLAAEFDVTRLPRSPVPLDDAAIPS